MISMEDLLGNLNNDFIEDYHCGKFHVSSNELSVTFLENNQYYRIIGSTFNDGIYKYGEAKIMTAESFSGKVYVLAIPPKVISLLEEINSWITENEKAVKSPYTSESFGGYSYNRGDATSCTWEGHFNNKLKLWRKI